MLGTDNLPPFPITTPDIFPKLLLALVRLNIPKSITKIPLNYRLFFTYSMCIIYK